MKNKNNKLLRKTLGKLLVQLVMWTACLGLVMVIIAYVVDEWNFEWLFRSYDAYAVWVDISTFLFSTGGIFFILPVIWVIGDFVIIYRLLKKVIGYISAISEASTEMFSREVEYVELPPELEEVEKQMNHLKRESERNERLAREAEQRKNDLVVYLAHDLKTPLTSVIGYLTLLRDENQISEELREKYLSISLEKAERLEDLINEFFEITRFNLTNLTLEYSRVNLTRLLEQLTYEFKPMFLEKNLDCVLEIAPDTMIKCDVDKLQRVFDNLLRNAVNYSFEDGIVHIGVVQDGSNIRLQFMNHGNTIPKEKLERIFEQFYRLDTARSSRSGGAGLGLAIAKEIVELHGGTITASSENEFVVFEVTLPLL